MSKNIEKELDYGAFETDMAIKYAEMQNQLAAMQIKQDALQKEKDIAVAVAAKVQSEAGATAVAPGSGKKVYTKEHPDRHAAAVLAAAPVLLELKKLANNYEALWWVAKHVEELSAGDKPEWHKSYKEWAKQVKIVALAEYMGCDVDAVVDADDE